MSCKNTWVKAKDKGVRFFKFPNDKNLAEKWAAACGQDAYLKGKNYRVCSEHFTEDDWSLKDKLLNTPFNKRTLKENAIPTVNVTDNKKKRQKTRNRKFIDNQAIVEDDE